MEGFAEKKAEKLIRVNVDFSDRIEGIMISGDFFIHPEEALEAIESLLTGLKLTELDHISSRIAGLLAANEIQLVGVTPEIIQDVVKEAVGGR